VKSTKSKEGVNMSEHWLKITPEYFTKAKSGEKPFEVRKDDKTPPYAVSDILHLQEYTNGEYTGRETTVIVTYVLRDTRYCPDGFCILGIKPVHTVITILLPDGRKLVASDKNDSDYPGVQISIVSIGGTEDIIAWAEYNTCRTDYSANQKLRLLL